jgi:hypothetical protein
MINSLTYKPEDPKFWNIRQEHFPGDEINDEEEGTRTIRLIVTVPSWDESVAFITPIAYGIMASLQNGIGMQPPSILFHGDEHSETLADSATITLGTLVIEIMAECFNTESRL